MCSYKNIYYYYKWFWFAMRQPTEDDGLTMLVLLVPSLLAFVCLHVSFAMQKFVEKKKGNRIIKIFNGMSGARSKKR